MATHDKTFPGGTTTTVVLDTNYEYTQVTIYGRAAGTVTVTTRPMLPSNKAADFVDAEFESITDGSVDLAAATPKRTLKVLKNRLSAIRFADAGTGAYKVYIEQWGFVTQ
jgi:hypothetical protein